MNRSDWYHGSNFTINTESYSNLIFNHTSNGGAAETYMTFTYNTGSTRQYSESNILAGTYNITEVQEISFQSFNTGGWGFSISLQ